MEETKDIKNEFLTILNSDFSKNWASKDPERLEEYNKMMTFLNLPNVKVTIASDEDAEDVKQGG